VSDHLPVVVIVGGGFGGLAAAKALKNTRAEVILIDRTNHHLFQPLLYQVATSELTPGQIGSPIRAILRKQQNTTVVLGEVIGIDKDEQSVVGGDANRAGVRLHYDYLILATGATHSYFKHEEFRKHAPGLKNLADAVAVRNKILSAFEVAEAEEDPHLHRDLLTFVLVGAGPTVWRWPARSRFWYAIRCGRSSGGSIRHRRGLCWSTSLRACWGHFRKSFPAPPRSTWRSWAWRY